MTIIRNRVLLVLGAVALAGVLALPILGLVLIGSVLPLLIESFHSPPRARRVEANGGGPHL